MALGMFAGLGGGSSLGTLFVRLTADASGLVRGFDQAETRIDRSGRAMLRVVGKLGAGVAATMGVIGAASVKAASDFESSFAGVRKTVNASEGTFALLQNNFRQLSKEIPISVNEINNVAEAAGQLGIQTSNIEEFTKAMLEMGVATNLQSTEAATALARFANITGMAQTEFSRLGSTIVALGNSSATTESEIADMALRIAGAGSQVGLSESQILGFSAALSSVGVRAEAGGTAISQMMIRMSKAVAQGGEELNAFARAAGVTASDFQQMFRDDATGAILTFLDGLRQLSSQGEDIFTMMEQMGLDGARMADIITRAAGAGDLFAESLRLGEQAWRDNNALSKEAEERYKTFASQVTLLINNINDMLITIGQGLIPILKMMNNAFLESTNNSREFNNTLQQFSINFSAAFITGIGLIADAVYSLRLIIKGLQVLTAGMVEGVAHLFNTMANALSTVMETITNTIIGGVNLAIDMVNNVLMVMPDWMIPGPVRRINRIEWRMEVDNSPIQDTVEILAEVRKQGQEELNAMWDAGPPSQRMLEQYDEAVNQMKKSGEKANEEAKKQADDTAKAIGEQYDQHVQDFIAFQEQIKANSGQVMGEIAAMQQSSPTGMSGGRQFGAGDLFDFDASYAAGLNDEADIAQENLNRLREIQNSKLELNEKTEEQLVSAMEQYNRRIADLQRARNAFVLGTSSRMFEDLASMTKSFAGEQSGIYKAMFAASKAFAIAESIVKIQQGIANAAALPWPANLAAIASVVAATANIVSTIQSVKLELGGKREHGGPVSAGVPYEVGERGREIFVPQSDGQIISNLDKNKMGGGVRVVINNYTDAQPEVTERQEGNERVVEVLIRRVKDEIGSEIRDGRGNVTRAMETTFNLRRGQK